jgi:2,4-dienoyl-CoA reductase-like NADH-dependent reductase (Old Yellow Enzyme family)
LTSLFEQLRIRNTDFRNRVWVSPMCQYSATDGVVGEWHRIHLGSFATGGNGLILVEATGVSADARISVGCTGIWTQEQADAFKPMIEFAHSMGTKMGIQLAHAGRKGSTLIPWADHEIAKTEEGGWQTVAPSAISFRDFPVPKELSEIDIQKIIDDFTQAAKRAILVGFDVLEIHAAHGYLLHQFYSPLSNKRTDSYGGDFNGRIKLLMEVVESVRACMPEGMPLFVRISATDWKEDGWDSTQSVLLAQRLKDAGVDLLDVSTGGLVHDATIPVGPGYQVSFSSDIKRNVDILTSAVGMITTPKQASDIIESGQADAVMLAREMLRNPRWAMQAAEELDVRIDWPLQLERARKLKPRPSPQ